jgi:hypothetical protein
MHRVWNDFMDNGLLLFCFLFYSSSPLYPVAIWGFKMAFLGRKKHPITQKIFNVLLSCGFEDSYILNIEQKGDIVSAYIHLSPYCELEDLVNILPNLKQEVNALDAKIGKVEGKRVEILFGKRNLSDVLFDEKYIHPNTLKIELPSSFGSSVLDFSDGASCHLLNGGTTRMGKTCFLLYLSTVLYLQTKGDMQLYITSTKLKDFYPFQGLNGVSLCKTDSDLLEVLQELIQEYKYRDSLLYSKELEKATDAKSVKELYPHKYHLFKPIFFIIDEYARFSEHKAIQLNIMELVESAGYVNVHVIISTQRPDARTVLPPRIKCNLLARICFTTTDKNNSMVILDQEGAEQLGKIKGRAIFLDSETNIIQVPYLDVVECDELLKPFRKDVVHHVTNESEERPINPKLADKIQDMFKESVSDLDIQEQYQSSECMQSDNEKIIGGWERLASETRKG